MADEEEVDELDETLERLGQERIGEKILQRIIDIPI
jgi:hypothetical protein